MVKLSKREELIFTELSRFKEIVLQKKDDISDCSIDVQNGFRSSVKDHSGTLINQPTGEKQVKVLVLFGSPSPKDTQSYIVDCVKEFVGNIQKGLAKKEMEIQRFITNFDIDVYNHVEIDYQWVKTDEED